MSGLLAVDLGLRTGLALYEREEEQVRLRWYRSHNLGSVSRLKRASYDIVQTAEALEFVYVEGDRRFMEIWEKVTHRRGAQLRWISAEIWRPKLFYERDRRSGEEAKKSAGVMARKAIEHFGAKRPTSLRHDAAEAILIGLYGALEEGWCAPELIRALR